jgi:hypothetical protein
MVLALRSRREKIPRNTVGEHKIHCEETFPTKINKGPDGKHLVDVAIKEFKFDQEGNEQAIDIVQVGTIKVEVEGSNERTISFDIRCRLENAGKYTGEVTALIIADVAPPPTT